MNASPRPPGHALIHVKSRRCRSCAATHVGLVRRSNEDAYLCRDDVGLWAVADGLGGHAAGELASRTVVDCLQAAKAGDFEDLLANTHRALQAANTELTAMDAQAGPGRSPGSTVALLLVHGEQGAASWAGDSRIYLLREARLRQLTRDHSHVQELVDEGLIARNEAENHPLAHALTRAVGINTGLELDTLRLDVRPGDRFLLCSDGLSRLLSVDEMCSMLGGVDLEATVNTLLKAALDRGAPDNVTLVAVHCSS